ncbi:MAG: hypothetical protein L0Y66_25800, partial [Myxococcaceae bacterium]|nr:hypothetical protein [Myxococcaceae bacterium]
PYGTAEATPAPVVVAAEEASPKRSREKETFLNQADAPPCHTCGEIMVRNGACYRCANCGATSGCS